MLIGHYAPALVLKRATPAVPLWVLFVAVQFLDVLWGPFILLGIERCRIVPGFTESNALDLYHMPWSHSLAMAVAWSCIFGGVLVWLKPGWGPRGKVFAVLAFAVLSHWLTDWLVHVPDLPLAPGATEVGLGLWRSRWSALALETSFVVIALLLAPKMKRAWLLWLFMPTVTVLSFFVPTPPAPAAMAATGLFTYAAYALLAKRADDASRGSA